MAGLLRGIGKVLSSLVPQHTESPESIRQLSRVNSPTSSYLLPSETQGQMTNAVNNPIRGNVSTIPVSGASSDSDGPSPVHGVGETHVPKLVWLADPRMRLKLRKRFYPLGLTRLTLGADLDLQSRDVSLKWSWKDRLIGGRLRFEGSQVSLSKRFDIDSRTHMYVRAAYDIHARRALFSLDVKPFCGIYANRDRPPGFAFKKKLPVDKHVSVEVLARVQLPEARFSTSNSISLGEGDFIIDLQELNLKFMLR